MNRENDLPILRRAVAEVPWGQNLIISKQLSDVIRAELPPSPNA